MLKNPVPCWADATRAIHSVESKRGLIALVTTAIVRTSNFNFASTAELKRFAEGKSKAYLYTRYGNPTLAVAEAKLADLENGEAGLVTASGMAAISSALLAVLKSGDEVIATRQLYGGSFRVVRGTLPPLGSLTHPGEAAREGQDPRGHST